MGDRAGAEIPVNKQRFMEVWRNDERKTQICLEHL